MKVHAGCPFAPRLVSTAVASCFAAGVALANPTGPSVVSGTASFVQQGNLLQITNSPNAIIHWQSFSIGANEITRFIQQSAASAVLNRVVGQDPSAILGALQSNGRVFLINPNGILFGAGAQIDVAGLVASTLDLSNADFLAGRLRFTEVPGAGSVVNQGYIATGPGGQVYLVGPSVSNSGIITTPKGEVVLAAGHSVELVNPGTPNLRVEITAAENEARNLGSIVAEAGRVGIYAGLIQHSGTIRADSAVSEGGRILLKATKSAKLENSSLLSAQGAGGGEIAVLAGETVQVAGRLDASAPNGGDGGFIETSARNVRVASGTVVTTTAAQGKPGTWLIDPTDFTVSDGDGELTASGIGAGTLSANLASNSVVISTHPEGAEPGDIFVNAPVEWSSGNDLTLLAHGDINVNSRITSTGGGTVKLAAGWDGTSIGTININAPISVSSDSGFSSVWLEAGKDINVNAAEVTATVGASSSSGPKWAQVFLQAGKNIRVDRSTIRARGGDGASFGGSALVQLGVGPDSDGIALSSSTVEALGGNGESGGWADLRIYGDIKNILVDRSTIRARGGDGASSGGSAFVELLVYFFSDGITLSRSTVEALGGSGESGGTASVRINWGSASIVDSILRSIGGTGSELDGAAFVSIEGKDVTIRNSLIKADGAEGSITVSSALGIVAENSSLVATGTGCSTCSTVVELYATGPISMGSSEAVATGANSAEGSRSVYVSAGSGDVTLGRLETDSGGTVSVWSAGAILDGNAGMNILAPEASLFAQSGIGSIANPIETAVQSLYLDAFAGEINIVNHGDLTLNSLVFGGTGAAVYASTQFGAASGTLALGSDIDVTGNLSLLSDTGMTVSRNLTSRGGTIFLSGGDGNLDVVPSAGPLRIEAPNVVLAGVDVNVGSPSAGFSTDIVAMGSGLLAIAASRDLNVVGGSVDRAYASLRGLGNSVTIATAGNVNVTGGTGRDAFAQVLGDPEVILDVAGTVNVSATSPNAPARIESVASETIRLYFPARAAGGFFVNGVENAVFDSATQSGFFANGAPAVLGQSLVVTYGGALQTSAPSLEAPNEQTQIALNELSKLGQNQGESGTALGPDEEERKKELPICR
jgi:filamentous hemagglutinin family protein